MGLQLLALTYQPMLIAVQEHASDAVVTALHNEKYLQGEEDAIVANA